MRPTRWPRCPFVALTCLALLCTGPAATLGQDTPSDLRIVLEIRGLHYDAGDPIHVRISAENHGDDSVRNPLADPLATGFRLTDAAGTTHEPRGVGQARPDQRPSRLAPGAYFGTVIELTEHFPALAAEGSYRLLYRGGHAESNPVELKVITEFRLDRTYAAVIKTAHGTLKLDLFTDDAPLTVRNFVDLSRQGFYDGLTFHYVRPGDLIVGGDPNGDGTGGSGFRLPAEFNSRRHLAGTVGMVRTADPNSASSQFYICLAPRPERDNRFTVFAQVVEGFDTLEAFSAVPTTQRDERPYFRPREPLVIESITILESVSDSEGAS